MERARYGVRRCCHPAQHAPAPPGPRCQTLPWRPASACWLLSKVADKYGRMRATLTKIEIERIHILSKIHRLIAKPEDLFGLS
eukprot:3136619-Pleurochrysis_carterae.AAC.2